MCLIVDKLWPCYAIRSLYLWYFVLDMGKSQETFGKKDREKKRLKKRQEKELKRAERKENNMKGAGFDNMISYVDEFGQLTDTPPDPTKKKKVDAGSIELGVPKREKEDPNAPRMGKVAFFNDDKGYGFINETDSEEKFFVHVSGCLDKIKENDKVTFNLERGERGVNAVQVKKV